MDFSDSPEEAQFRAEVREWLAANLPHDWLTREPKAGLMEIEAAADWAKRLYEAGYVGITWPREYGGRGLGSNYHVIFLEEAGRAHSPAPLGVIGLGMAGPTILAWGTPEQKLRLVPKILSGEEIWCQGFSEPGSGSDLAAARTTAELDGNEWVVNGQKVWSSFAHVADWCILVVRTDPSVKKHKGLSYLLVDMHSPGVEVRPLKQITGDPEFNEIFFTDVRVPKDSILGKPGDGWLVAMTTLLHERGSLGFALTGDLDQTVGRVVRLAKEPDERGRRPADDPLVRDRITQAWIDLQALRYVNYRSLTEMLKTGIPGPEGSIAKLHWSESNQSASKLAVEIEQLAGQLDGEGGIWDGYWQHHQLRSRGNTIEAGTSEILRTIIAERVVGLPRSH